MLPRDVKCPQCGADKRWPCLTTGGYRAKTHAKRWVAAGIHSPTADDRHRDYIKGISDDIELGREALAQFV